METKRKLSKDVWKKTGPLVMGPFEKLNVDFLSLAKKIDEFFDDIGYKVNMSDVEKLDTGEDRMTLRCAQSTFSVFGAYSPVLQILIKGNPDHFSLIIDLHVVAGSLYSALTPLASKTTIAGILMYPKRDNSIVYEIPKFIEQLKNSGS
ncbi:hypothetical protein [Nitrosopumilus sp.]|uniref:hypothetical protein n=1 Tax=Nitrosopumilus sp. TaxID=2024843 RepID=UPI003D0B9F26